MMGDYENAAVIFVATFLSVLAVGVEMRAIVRKRQGLAALAACIIAGGQIVALKLVPSSGSWADVAAYVLANGLGILASFRAYAAVHSRQDQFHPPFDVCEGRRECFFAEAHACKNDVGNCLAYAAVRKAVGGGGAQGGDVAVPRSDIQHLIAKGVTHDGTARFCKMATVSRKMGLKE